MLTRKTFVSFCILILVSIGLTTHVYARNLDYVSNVTHIDVDKLWTHTALISADIHVIGNGTITMSGSVLGNPGTSSITVNAVLERQNSNGSFSSIASFNNIRATGIIWDWTRQHSVARGHTYRLTLTATVTRNGTSEVVTASSRPIWIG